jgi:hypothetical protein
LQLSSDRICVAIPIHLFALVESTPLPDCELTWEMKSASLLQAAL